MNVNPQEITPAIDADDASDEIDLREILHSILAHKWAIMGLAVVVAMFTIVWVYSLTPEYKATATVLVEQPEKNNIVSVDDIYGYSGASRFYHETQFKVLESRDLAKKVVIRLKLHENTTFMGVQKEKEEESAISQAMDSFKSIITAFLRPSDLEVVKPDYPRLSEEETLINRATRKFMDSLSINPIKRSQLAEVSFQSTDPELAAIVANALIETYIDSDLEARMQMTQRAASWLTERLSDLRKKLEASEAALQAYRKRERVVDVKDVRTFAASQHEALTQQFVKARGELTDVENLYSQIKAISGGDTSQYESIPAVLDHPLVQNFKTEEQKVARRISELSKRYGPKHPKMIAAQSEMSTAKAQLARQIRSVVASIEKQYQIARANTATISKSISQNKQELRAIDSKEYQLGVLEREVESNKQLYDMFLTRYKEAGIANELQTAYARIVDPAVAPNKPFKPKKMLIVMIAIVISLFLGMVSAVILESWDNTFKHAAEVESKLGLTVLGLLPLLRDKDLKGKDKRKIEPSRYLSQLPQSIFAEAVRTIRTAVMLSGLDNPHKVVVVTSTVPKEGKSTVSMNLAQALGQMESVLLIDADMRRPSVAKSLSLPDEAAGLSNIVVGTSKFEDCVHHLEQEKIDVVTSGVIPPNPLELLSSVRFQEVLKELESKYDRIVIDSAPAQAVSDSLVLSKYANAVVFVVQADATPAPLVQGAVKRLRDVNAPLVGAVLNQLDGAKSGYSKYGKYSRYGYYQRNYYGYDSAKS